MGESEAIVRRMPTAAIEEFELDQERRKLLQQTIANGLSVAEFGVFVEYVQRARLDPFRRQIVPLKIEGKLSIHVGIDGLRLIAQRSTKYRGQTPPQWCGPDGKWLDVWLSDEPPAAARIGIYHDDMAHPIWGLAKYREFVQRTKEGQPNRMWSKMTSHMLAKCAEALAIRKAFPAETSGLYVTVDEDGEVDTRPRLVNPDAPATNYQKGELMRLARELGWSTDERRAQAGGSFTELTKAGASRLIDEWAALIDDRAGASPAEQPAATLQAAPSGPSVGEAGVEPPRLGSPASVGSDAASEESGDGLASEVDTEAPDLTEPEAEEAIGPARGQEASSAPAEPAQLDFDRDEPSTGNQRDILIRTYDRSKVKAARAAMELFGGGEAGGIEFDKLTKGQVYDLIQARTGGST
jgi:phage recombination protein Bet